MTKKKKALIFFVIILLLLSILCCLGVFIFSVIRLTNLDDSFESNLDKGELDQTVAIIDIQGVISSEGISDLWGNETPDMVSGAITQMDKILGDSNVKAVLLRVDTPGGEVYGTRRIYNKIKELRNNNIPVVVLMQSSAASGGYYVSAPADWIIASEMTLTGSIGVRMSMLDYDGLYDKIGVKEIHVVNSQGKMKILDELEDENSEGYKVLQSVIDDYYDNFVDIVADGRGMTVGEVEKLADGRVYSGQQALDNGLIDQLGEINEALNKVSELADLDDPNYVVYESTQSSLNFTGFSLIRIFGIERTMFDQITDEPGLKIDYLLYY